MSSYNINIVEPQDEGHYLTDLSTSSNTLGLDLAADSFGPTNQSSFSTHSTHHGQLPSGSSVDYNSYGSAVVAENPSRPTLTHLNTTLGHSLSRSPINSGLHSSTLSSTNNSPNSFLRDDIDIMRPSYSQHAQQAWSSSTGLSSINHWDVMSSPYSRSSSSIPNLSPVATSPYHGILASPCSSSMSSPGSQGSPLAGSQYPTPSPRQDAPPLTPQSVNGVHNGVRIESSPSQHSMYMPDTPAAHGHNAMDVQLGSYTPLLPPLPSASNGFMNSNTSFDQLQLYPNPTPVGPYVGPAGYGHGGMGVPFQQQTCNPNQVFGNGLNAMYDATDSIQVPQTRYRPHTSSDQRRYVDEVKLQPDIYFFVSTPNGPKPGIPLRDAITSKFMRLTDRDEPLFQGCGPSISVRLSWKGYQPWSRQIPTRDFRSPPGPITKSKLAKNVAKSVQRFIEEHKEREMEPGSDLRWAVGPGKIDVDDLLLVSMVHVSMGSWQAILHLNRPLRQTH